MSNHSYQVIRDYLQHYATYQPGCVMALLFSKSGNSYRQTGAIKIVAADGQAFGGLSGGCLEQTIVREAHKASLRNQPHIAEFDTRDPDDAFAQFQSGCQGQVQILMMPLSESLYQCLWQADQQLKLGQSLCLRLSLSDPDTVSLQAAPASMQQRCIVTQQDQQKLALFRIDPAKRLLLIGAGYDTVPLVSMALTLGWQIAVWDDRLHYGMHEVFKKVSFYKKSLQETLQNSEFAAFIRSADAAVLASHHLAKDVDWLVMLSEYQPDYLAMVGPRARKEWVLSLCNEQVDQSRLNWMGQSLRSPAGLDIGGDTPESVALSILAEAHAAVYISNVQ